MCIMVYSTDAGRLNLCSYTIVFKLAVCLAAAWYATVVLQIVQSMVFRLVLW